MYQSVTAPSRLLLWVYTNPARGVRKRDTAYYKWHEAELLPALLDMPPSLFLSCSRWAAADGAARAYLSLYDLSARRSAAHDPAYVALSEKHALETPRAAAFVVESRVYEPVVAPAPLPPRPWHERNGSGTDESDGDGDDGRAPRTRYITVIEAELHTFAEGEFCRWYDEEHIPLLARVPGWVRSRRYVLQGKLGDPDSSDRPPKFLAIHEWASLDALETKQYMRATNTPWRTEVLKEGRVLRYEIRVFRAA
ncbi:hypothetical protein LXA43DRAFT_888206 [Ganoderma leucocontextum]|nr:hypothetical protein LXA43DRAFT_888206 [Ganoderma leucocontextum]